MKTHIALFVGIALLAAPAVASDDEMTSRLRDLAAAELGMDPVHVQVVSDDTPDLAAGIDAYTFRFASVPRGRTVVRARAEDQRSLSFTVDVQIWDHVAVARHPVDRGTTLDASLFGRVWREVTHASPVSLDDLTGLRARRNVRPGTILVADQVEVIPLVHRGSPVTLLAQSGTIKITRKGTALTDAQLGEVVRVRVDRRTIIAGVVAGPGLCRVDL